MASVARVAPAALKQWLHDGAEIALLDVREQGEYGESHLFYGVSLPYSRLEIDIARLAPRAGVRLVLYNEGPDGTLAWRAGRRLLALGYTAVHVLDGGVAGWRAAGYACFAGVNVPSKTFGELAEHVYRTPRISAEALAAKLAAGENLVVLDGRPFAEFQKMNIPEAICCPNGELALRVRELAPDPATAIVINCAGRTRSIIGAQTLINLGIPNPVYALENGTQGWYLAGLALEHGTARRYAAAPPAAAMPALRQQARRMAERAGAPAVDAAQVQAWLRDTARTTFLCDVRTAEEFETGSLEGARHTPGGQLIQATDQYVGVRGARLVLCDGEGVRAPAVASWLRQMGWEAYMLDEGGARVSKPRAGAACAHKEGAATLTPPQRQAPALIASAALADAMRQGAVLIDVRASGSFRAAHIDGARWAIRPMLPDLPLAADARIVLLTDDMAVARLAMQELGERGLADIRINADTPAQWRGAGLELAHTPHEPPDSACIDFLFFVHDRHSGNAAAARQYLAWEIGLLDQIDEQERASFRFPH
jgi:rhodanese-related sulfurtransferase